MSLFQEIEGEVAILVNNGVYKQTPLYKRAGYLYAKLGSGFIRLLYDGSTSVAKVRLETITWSSGLLGKDALGRLAIIGEAPGVHPLGKPHKQKLLGAAEA